MQEMRMSTIIILMNRRQRILVCHGTYGAEGSEKKEEKTIAYLSSSHTDR